MTEVYLEIGKKRVFACALEWPGWCRTAKTEHDALMALDEYAARYAVIAKRARIAFKPGELTVVENVPGGSTTDFGAPEKPAAADARPLDAKGAQRQATLVRAAWDELDEVAAATPEELLKGPRGGGRDRDKMLDHVVAAEAAYARKIGLKPKVESYRDAQAVAGMREAVLSVLGGPSDGKPLVERGWLSRYAARRIAWHTLDHLWEMQDKTPQ
jgi:hypothetical protein